MDRFERQRAWFGEVGQQKIQSERVAIIGLGGLGSHIAQQLAFLGTRHLLFIDPDVLDETNKNRLIGVRSIDVFGTPKVRIAKRFVKEIDPEIHVDIVQDKLDSLEARGHLKSVGWVFGCVDNDGARLLLMQQTSERKQNYVDLATEIFAEESPPVYGGRVCVMTERGGCLFCLNLLSQEDIRKSLATSDQAVDLKDIYGIERAALGNSGPAVVTINGVVASLAVTEFMVAVTETREPMRLLEYRADLGRVSRSLDEPAADCPYCAWRQAEKK